MGQQKIIEAMQVPERIVDALVREASCLEQIPKKSTTGRVADARLPLTWCAESNIQLMPSKDSDTTDRTLFRRAARACFDLDGFENDYGLQRPLFYKSGYLTCTKCNDLTFIDAAALRTILELSLLVDLRNVTQETLPSCVRCRETGGLRVGAHDFLGLIEGKMQWVGISRTGSQFSNELISSALES